MKTIPGFPNYCATKDGRIWSKPRRGKGCSEKGKWLKMAIRENRHLYVYLYKNGKQYKRYIHRLVLETFVGICPKNMECCHNDGNPKNNHVSNLRWDTKKANFIDSMNHGTLKQYESGEKHPQAKLTKQNIRMIIYMYKTKLFSQREIAGIYNVCTGHISRIINKKKWKHIWCN